MKGEAKESRDGEIKTAMASHFRENVGKLVRREYLAKEFLGDAEKETLFELGSRYIPDVRDMLEEVDGHTLRNIPGKGWIFCEGGENTYQAVRANARRLAGSADKLIQRCKSLQPEKFSESTRGLIKVQQRGAILINNAIDQNKALIDSIDKALDEEGK